MKTAVEAEPVNEVGAYPTAYVITGFEDQYAAPRLFATFAPRPVRLGPRQR